MVNRVWYYYRVREIEDRLHRYYVWCTDREMLGGSRCKYHVCRIVVKR